MTLTPAEKQKRYRDKQAAELKALRKLAASIQNTGEVNKMSRVSKRKPELQIVSPRSMALDDRIDMSLEEWYEIEPNPRQRDTAAHAAKAAHLREYSPEHRIVKMAVLPNGQNYKLDGHTRAHLWRSGEVTPPFTSVLVDVFKCQTIDDVKELYRHYDNKAAVETGVHLLQGAAREANLHFQSPLMRSFRFGTAIRESYAMVQRAQSFGEINPSWGIWSDPKAIYIATKYFREALLGLDSLNPSVNIFHSGVIMAALITIQREDTRQKALSFFDDYQRDRGMKDDEHFDAVHGLRAVYLKTSKRAGATSRTDLCSRAIAAFEAYSELRYYKVGGSGPKVLSKATLDVFLRKLPKIVEAENHE